MIVETNSFVKKADRMTGAGLRNHGNQKNTAEYEGNRIRNVVFGCMNERHIHRKISEES